MRADLERAYAGWEKLTLERGRLEGIAKGWAEALPLLVNARGSAVSGRARQRIMRCADIAQLEAWIRRAVRIAWVEELFE